jgi:hypothetical protein
MRIIAAIVVCIAIALGVAGCAATGFHPKLSTVLARTVHRGGGVIR